MARLMEKTIKRPLSELLLFGDVPDGGTVTVDLAGEGLSVLKS
jgi:ATP-dependent Clp protease ATP-binding subunit ClpA